MFGYFNAETEVKKKYQIGLPVTWLHIDLKRNFFSVNTATTFSRNEK